MIIKCFESPKINKQGPKPRFLLIQIHFVNNSNKMLIKIYDRQDYKSINTK